MDDADDAGVRRYYHPAEIEPRWQKRWLNDGLYELDDDDRRETRSVLSMNPFPSGPAHIGHVRNCTFGDVLVRYHTMNGRAVLSPIGFDSFGLPAENAAIKSGEHPRAFTDARTEELTSSPRWIGAVSDSRRMSKSKGNTVAPEHAVDSHGADSLRLAILRTKPPAEDVDFEDFQLDGCERFLSRVWRLAATDHETINNLVNVVRSGAPSPADRDIETATHMLIDRITDEYERSAFNTAVAAFMESTNTLYRYVQSAAGAHGPTLAFAVDSLLLLMAPAVPHITAELWALRHDGEHVHTLSWPTANQEKLVVSSITMVIQVNGKVRDRADVPPGISDANAELVAMGSVRIQELLAGRQPSRIIVRAPRLVNVVA